MLHLTSTFLLRETTPETLSMAYKPKRCLWVFSRIWYNTWPFLPEWERRQKHIVLTDKHRHIDRYTYTQITLVLVSGADFENGLSDFRLLINDSIIDGAVELRSLVIHVTYRHLHSCPMNEISTFKVSNEHLRMPVDFTGKGIWQTSLASHIVGLFYFLIQFYSQIYLANLGGLPPSMASILKS